MYLPNGVTNQLRTMLMKTVSSHIHILTYLFENK